MGGLTGTGASTETQTYLEVALAIGRSIAAEAIWHGQRCNWIGAVPEETAGGGTTMTYQALKSDVYGGSAGIGLFLAELASSTGDTDLRRTATGALRHAASRGGALPEATRTGLYAGVHGVALALAYAGRLLDEEELRASAVALLEDEPWPAAGGEFDLIAGHAGAVIGLLALDGLIENADLTERAEAHGDALLAAALRQTDGIAWQSPSPIGERPLTGYSHGTAGVATALLELTTATGSDRYNDAVAGALNYERGLYDAEARNWPDLRQGSHQGARPTPSFATFWCHGAPGIALSRLRSVERGVADAEEEALIGLETTAHWVDAALRAGINYSLCHGLAGNAEILSEGAALLGERATSAVAEVANRGIEAYHSRGAAWPSGAHGGYTPTLFLGDAGIGRFYLRLADPSAPSLLLVRPESFS
jgi:lantibiotic modifying enzyme